MASNKESMIKKLGGVEAYIEWQRKNGKKGGKAKVPKGYAIKPRWKV